MALKILAIKALFTLYVQRQFTALQEPFFWAGVSDQWLSTTLDQNYLIGLGQNTELAVCKKHLMYIILILLSFKKLHPSVMIINT